MAKDKRARSLVQPHPSRKPGAIDLQDWEQAYPIWRLSQMDWDGPWAWTGHDGAVWEKVHRKLGEFETQKWGELQRNRAQAKKIAVKGICREAKRRLQGLNKDDLADLWELHLDGLGRVWGIRDRGVFSVLWWDPNHSVYPSRKRHT